MKNEAHLIHGGCRCGSIRYRLTVPDIKDRRPHPMSIKSSPCALPFVAIDHCNDCRAATSSILPTWICAPAEIVEVAVKSDSEQEEIWQPGTKILWPGNNPAPLAFYESSPYKKRWFCSKCGTNLAYAADPEYYAKYKIFPIIDFLLGSVDRVELDDLEPDRQLWWDCGVKWIQNFSIRGLEHKPRHGTFRVDEFVS